MLNYLYLSRQIPYDQNFPLIRRNKQIYVDKTDIIYDLAYENRPQFLSRPCRFGKSTIISILKELFTHGKFI